MDRTYVYEGAGSGSTLESALVGSMMNGGMGGGMWNNPIWAIVFLAALRNGGLFGNDGGNGYHSQLSQIQDTLNTNQGNTLLMDAIKGNQSAISQLATTIGCNHNAVVGAINAVQSAISGVANQVGMSGMQVINSIQSGNAALTSTLQSCCCDVKGLVTNLNYEGRLADQAQTAFLGGKIDAQTTLINDKFCQLELRGVQDKLDQERAKTAALTNQLSQEHQNRDIAAMINPLYKEIDAIKCKLPQTATIPYSPVVGIPSCVAYQYGLNALAGGYPYAGGNGGFL